VPGEAATVWPDRLFTPGPKRILSIDGGGVRGALAIGLLHKLERILRERYDRPDMVLSDYFDLIGGTSVGAILSAGLALGHTTDEAIADFRKMGPRLFRQKGVRIPFVQARFDPRIIERLLYEEFGDCTLGSAAWKTGFAAVSKRVDTGSTWLLTNCPRAKYWDGSPDEAGLTAAERTVTPNADYPLAKVVQSSAAAPLFFDLVSLEIARGDPGVFFDGAVTPHGNPALQLVMAGLIPAYGFGWEQGADKLLVVSVGAGAPRPRKPEWVSGRLVAALLKAVHALVSMSYDTGELATSVLQWLGTSPQPWRINSELGDMADARPRGLAPLWTVLRYDAPLEQRWLTDQLGMAFSGPEMIHLIRMDDDRLIERLYAIGQAAAEIQIKPEHFGDAFAPAPMPQ
jgi:hypothetical protein